MLTCAHSDVQVTSIMKVVVAVEESVANQRSPDHGGHLLGQIETSRLIVEVIAPTGSVVAGGLIVDQPIESIPCLVGPGLVAGGVVKTHEAARQKAHPLGGALPGNS